MFHYPSFLESERCKVEQRLVATYDLIRTCGRVKEMLVNSKLEVTPQLNIVTTMLSMLDGRIAVLRLYQTKLETSAAVYSTMGVKMSMTQLDECLLQVDESFAKLLKIIDEPSEKQGG